MTTKYKILNCTPGLTTVQNRELAFLGTTGIKGVFREGIGYNVIYSGTPSSMDVLYNSSSGRFTFGTANNQGATVYVLYQY